MCGLPHGTPRAFDASAVAATSPPPLRGAGSGARGTTAGAGVTPSTSRPAVDFGVFVVMIPLVILACEKVGDAGTRSSGRREYSPRRRPSWIPYPMASIPFALNHALMLAIAAFRQAPASASMRVARTPVLVSPWTRST
jgi:hypothetical protein